MTRYVVRVGELYAAASKGHDWRARKPRIPLVSQAKARLFLRKADATRVSTWVGGTVVPVEVLFPLPE